MDLNYYLVVISVRFDSISPVRNYARALLLVYGVELPCGVVRPLIRFSGAARVSVGLDVRCARRLFLRTARPCPSTDKTSLARYGGEEQLHP